MTSRTAWLWSAVCSAVGLALVCLLFASLNVSFGDAFAAFASSPLWLFSAVAGLTFANKIVGAAKWRVAANYLTAGTDGPDFLSRVQLTTLGAVFGQFIPIQLSALLTRWFLMDRAERTPGQALGSTIFEQAFDLVLVGAGAFAALAILAFGMSPAGALGTFVGVVGIAFVALRPVLLAVAQAAAAFGRFGVLSSTAHRAADGISTAALAPARIKLILAGYSLLRLIIVGLRAVAVVWVFAPAVPAWLVFVATPAVTLLTALPLTPAGLGIAEWSWSAILIAGGASAGTAAIAALNLRLVSMAALFAIFIVLAALRHFHQRQSRRMASDGD